MKHYHPRLCSANSTVMDVRFHCISGRLWRCGEWWEPVSYLKVSCDVCRIDPLFPHPHQQAASPSVEPHVHQSPLLSPCPAHACTAILRHSC